MFQFHSNFSILLCVVSLLSAHERSSTTTTLPQADVMGDPLPTEAVSRLGTTRFKNADRWLLGLYHNSYCFSHDGKRIATTSELLSSHSTCGITRIFDIETGKLLFPPLFDTKQSIAFFPDNSNLLVRYKPPSRVEIPVIYNLNSGKVTYLDEELYGWYAVVSPNGKTYAVPESSDVIRICSFEDVKVVHRLKKFGLSSYALVFSQDGNYLISTSGGKGSVTNTAVYYVDVWDLKTSQRLYSLLVGDKVFKGVALVNDDKVLVVAEQGNRLRAWDFKSKKDIEVPGQPITDKEIDTMVGSPDGKYLAILERQGNYDVGDIQVLDGSTFKRIGSIQTYGKALHKLVFSPDSKLLAVSGNIPGMKLYDVATLKEVMPLPGHEEGIVTVEFSPDGRTLASRSCGHTVRFWDLATGKERKQFRLGPLRSEEDLGVSAMCFSRDGGKMVAIGAETPKDRNDTLLIWNVEDEKKPLVFPIGDKPERQPVYTVVASPEGNVFGATIGGSLVVWSMTSCEKLVTIPGTSKSKAESLAFAPDGRSVLVGTGDRSGNRGTLHVFDWPTRRNLRTISTTGRWVSSMAFSPSGDFFASCFGTLSHWQENRATIELIDFPTGTLIRTLKGHDGPTRCVAFSPDGKLLASCGIRDRLVRLWNVFTGEEIAQFKGHEGAVNTVAFSPDGKLLASGSSDTTILVWDVSKYSATLPTTAAERIAELWEGVTTGKSPVVYGSLWQLAGGGESAVSMLKKHLQPVPSVPVEQLKKWMADLDSEDFQKRTTAFNELQKIGPHVEKQLKAALVGTPSAEVKVKVTELLEKMYPIAIEGQSLLDCRAILVLELIGSKSARDVLQTLSEGAENALVTVRAKSALERLKKR